MNLWHGYPIDRHADPERPWWVMVLDPERWHWERTDGVRAEGLGAHERRQIDIDNPVARPPLLAGQVWMFVPPDGPRFILVTDSAVSSTAELWRYRHALVDGPFAPWEPPEPLRPSR